jgi:hypothetical protein
MEVEHILASIDTINDLSVLVGMQNRLHTNSKIKEEDIETVAEALQEKINSLK